MNAPVARALPRGLRINNPGHIRRGPDKWQGMAPPEQQTDPAFVTFVSIVYGLRAIARILVRYQDHHGLHTIRQLIGRYAPPNENSTDAYIAFVSKRTGFHPDQPLDLHTYEHMKPLVVAIVTKEVGHGHGITEAQFDKGLVLMGVEPPAKPLAQTATVKAAQATAAGTLTLGGAIEVARQVGEASTALSPAIDTLQRFGPWLIVAVALAGIGYMVWRRIDDRRRALR